MRFWKYKWKDFLDLDIREEQEEIKPYQNEEVARSLEDSPNMFSSFSNDNIMAIGGLKHIWDGRAEAFAICSKDMKIRDFLELRSFTLKLCEDSDYKRIEATIPVGDKKYISWITGLGFKKEGLMKCYGLNGKDHYLYARIK